MAIDLAGTLTRPTSAFALATEHNISLTGTLTRPTGAFTVFRPAVLTLAGAVRLPTAVVALTVGSAVLVNGEPQPIFFSNPQGHSAVPLGLTQQILDATLIRAPTAVQVVVLDADPSSDIVFDIDGTEVFTAQANSEGYLAPTSIPVSMELGAAGSHTLTATNGTRGDADTFTLAREPAFALATLGPDTDPVEVPDTVVNGVRRWVLQDLMPDGLGSWVMPVNPDKITPLAVRKTINAQHTTAVGGQFHLTEANLPPVDFSFGGYCPDQDFYDQLLAYTALKRRFYLIDHRNRAWKVAFLGADLVARKRQRDEDGVPNDWAHDYTVTAALYDQTPRTPA